MSEELNLCPFCGGEASVNTNLDGYYIQCLECETFIDTRGVRKDAVSFWNKRAGAAEIEAAAVDEAMTDTRRVAMINNKSQSVCLLVELIEWRDNRRKGAKG